MCVVKGKVIPLNKIIFCANSSFICIFFITFTRLKWVNRRNSL